MFFRTLILPTFALAFLSPVSHAANLAAGPRSGGGGDLCEDRIQVVRDDIKAWIGNGGPNGLILPAGISVAQYSQEMLGKIAATKVACVAQGDSGFPVQVNGTPKVCVFTGVAGAERITCDSAKFMALLQDDQYVLVHHEYAGLAGLEIPDGDVSNYAISNQISGFLSNVEVKRLSVNKPQAQPDNDVRGNFSDFVGLYQVVQCQIQHQEGIDKPITNEGCYGADQVSLYFGTDYYSPSADGRELLLDFINTKMPAPLPAPIGNHVASFLVATAENDVNETCTTFPGTQFCVGESSYTHYIQDSTLKVEDGLLNVNWILSQTDTSHYNYTKGTVLLKKIIP